MLTLIATDCHGISAVTQELPTRQESLSVLLNDKSLDQELKATWNSEGHQPGTKDSKRNWSKDPTASVGPGQPLGGWQTTTSSLIYPDVSCCDVRRSFNEWRRRREQHWMQDISLYGVISIIICSYIYIITVINYITCRGEQMMAREMDSQSFFRQVLPTHHGLCGLCSLSRRRLREGSADKERHGPNVPEASQRHLRNVQHRDISRHSRFDHNSPHSPI